MRPSSLLLPIRWVRYLFCASVVIAVVGISVVGLQYVAAAGSPARHGRSGMAGGREARETLGGTALVVEHGSLEKALADAGVVLPPGTGVYAIRVENGNGSLAYAAHAAGEGASYGEFWPASAVKVLVAVGALEYLAELGFTGDADVIMEGETFRVTDLYEAAIAESSNDAYDILVEIAGLDWLNEEFLTAENGFPATVIQRPYAGFDFGESSEMEIVEGDQRQTVPARLATGVYGCDDTRNCTNLLELTESVRRLMLHTEIPEVERFDLAGTDVVRLIDALLASEGFFEPAASDVLGEDALVYNKPGYVPGYDCVDVALIEDTGTDRYLLAVATPDDGLLCPTLVEVASATLEFLKEEAH